MNPSKVQAITKAMVNFDASIREINTRINNLTVQQYTAAIIELRESYFFIFDLIVDSSIDSLRQEIAEGFYLTYKRLLEIELAKYTQFTDDVSIHSAQQVNTLLVQITSEYEKVFGLMHQDLNDRPSSLGLEMRFSGYQIFDFHNDCNESLHASMLIMEELHRCSKAGHNYERVLPVVFDFETFHSVMMKTIAYLCHQVDRLNAKQKQFSDYDESSEYVVQHKDEMVQCIIDAEKAILELTYFIESVVKMKSLIQIAKVLANLEEPDFGAKQLLKLEDTMTDVMAYLEHPTLRYQYLAIPENGLDNISISDIALAMIALQDYFRINREVRSPISDLPGKISLCEQAGMFLCLPDTMLRYFIENDRIDDLNQATQTPTPLRHILYANCAIDDPMYKSFCALDNPESIDTSRLLIEGLVFTKLDKISVVEANSLQFPTPGSLFSRRN